MKDLLGEYLENEQLMLIDRAFLGLYALFRCLKKESKKNKVVFTSTTCFSPIFAAIFAGMEPVFVDINLDNYLMDKQETLELLMKDDEIACLVYIYIFGHVAEDILEIANIAKSRNVYLIEDLAQAFASTIGERKTGSIGDAAVFSFGYSKHIDVGAGGALVLNSLAFSIDDLEGEIRQAQRYPDGTALSERYQQEFYAIRKLAIKDSKYYKKYVDFPDRYRRLYFKQLTVDWEQAKAKVSKFIASGERASRNSIAYEYQEGLAGSEYSYHFSLPKINDGASVYRYTFMVSDSDDASQISDLLRLNGIDCSNLYIPISRIYNMVGFDNALGFAQRVINLWVDDTVDKVKIQRTLDIIHSFYKHKDLSLV